MCQVLREWRHSKMAGALVLAALSTCLHASQISAPEVQLRALVQHAKKYEGKVVLVRGYLNLGREGDAICSDSREGVRAFCVAVERSNLFLKERSEQGHRVSF